MADLQDIKLRIQRGENVTEEERSIFLAALTKQLTDLKEQNPEEYLRVLRGLIEMLSKINASFEMLDKTPPPAGAA